MRTSRALSDEALAVAHYVDRCRQDRHQQHEHCMGIGAVADLERRVATLVGKKYCVATSSATAALMALPHVLDARRTDFVTTPATYGATIAGWLLAGGRPRFADVEPGSLTLDPDSVRRQITSRTSAIVAVDLFGFPADDDALRQLADEHGLWYIADASQALGARRAGRHASARADVIVVSFTAGKTVFAGEGGAVLTDDRELYERLVFYTQHPLRQRRELGLGVDNEFGFNARIHPLAAVWAAASMDRALCELAVHRETSLQRIAALNDTGITQPIDIPSSVEPTFFRLTATWRTRPRIRALQTAMQRLGHRIEVEPVPLRLLYAQHSFKAQYGLRLAPRPACPIAEEQWARRFCIR